MFFFPQGALHYRFTTTSHSESVTASVTPDRAIVGVETNAKAKPVAR